MEEKRGSKEAPTSPGGSRQLFLGKPGHVRLPEKNALPKKEGKGGGLKNPEAGGTNVSRAGSAQGGGGEKSKSSLLQKW